MQESIKTTLATSVWQISRQNLRFLTVLGEGNFGKVNNNCDIISLRNSKICGTLCTMYYISKKKIIFFQVWKAEAENICGYDGTVLVAVKTTKDKAPDKEKSGKNLFTFLLT